MKSEGAIRHKLKKVVYYHLKKAIRKKMSQKSWNCVHESEKPSRLDEAEKLRVCHTCTLMGGGCDDSDDSVPSRARQCPSFESKHDPQQTKTEFLTFLEEAAPGEIAYQYPDAFALMWMLDMDSAGDIASSIETIPTEDMLPPDPTKPLVESLGEVREAVQVLTDTLSAKQMGDPDLKGQVDELADRLNDMQAKLPAAPKGFWASLFPSLQ